MMAPSRPAARASRLYDQVLIRLEWGFPIPMGNRALSESSETRFHLSIDFEDKVIGSVIDKICKKQSS